ncbi:exo-beta-N-acetylmuramidase NamZ family protein [Ekhidna sp.]
MWKLIYISTLLFLSCSNEQQEDSTEIQVGAQKIQQYIPLLENKKVGLTVNHSSVVQGTHLTDTLMSSGIDVVKVFTPEHGFSGSLSDGLEVNYDNSNSAFQLISLYGKNKKPTREQVADLDVMVFDMQDVGARFYTYISTMHYVMEACAENRIPMIILDRPNPNGSYVDGPVLDTAFQSFVGMHPIPIVHGMTVGELAMMINEEGWLKNGVKVDLRIIKVEKWDHSIPYSLPIKPSPNLPDDLSISLYPSLCLFEGTIMSVGRGTDYAFQQIGHPEYPDTTNSFTPISREGAKWPPYEDQICYSESWIGQKPRYSFSLKPLIEAYQLMNRSDFFNDYFKRLAGTNQLQKQIESGMSEEEIRQSWKAEIDQFKGKRAKYLLY